MIKWRIVLGARHVAWVTLVLGLVGCGAPPYEPPPPDEPRRVVVWISIDGVRPDYLARANTPFFDRMMREGLYSLALAPAFPSLTFPNHVAQATGTTVRDHGVPLNSFYDREYDRAFFYPGQARLLQAEPIWNTAERQGVRAAVYDWVLSHNQRGDHAASYFGTGYDGSLRDRDRIRPLLQAWRTDRHTRPLQLFMGYMVTPDKIGHEAGPDATEIDRVMSDMDRHMAWFTRQAIRLFDRRMHERDELYIIVTSDHGMSLVHTAVNPRLLTGIDRDEEDNESGIIMMTTGNLAHVFLHHLPAEERDVREAEIVRRARQHPFVDVYRFAELPERWGYDHPTRVGDIVLGLRTGYTFSRRARELAVPIDDVGGPVGMHGYDLADNPEMYGIALIWRYRHPLGGVDLGPTDSLHLHATVAGLLEIEPAPQARPERLFMPPPP